MLWFEQELSKYLASKFVLKYNINFRNVFTLSTLGVCYCGLYLVYLEIDGVNGMCKLGFRSMLYPSDKKMISQVLSKVTAGD